jgi:hypothetical protein
MKEFLIRLSYKLTGFKALFTAAVLAVLVVHDLSPENADVMIALILAVLGTKAAQYGKEVVLEMRKEKSDE